MFISKKDPIMSISKSGTAICHT